jgi:hypothetical protein
MCYLPLVGLSLGVVAITVLLIIMPLLRKLIEIARIRSHA